MTALYATQANKVKALTDIRVFANLIEFQGGWNKFSVIHDKLAGFITAPQVAKLCILGRSYNRRRLALMPRGHLKSTVCSVLYTLWRIYRNPNIRILVGTNLKELSQAFIRELRQYFENPELQNRVWNKRPHIEGALVPVMDAASRKRRAQKNEDDETDTQDKKLIWSLSAIQVLRDGNFKEPTVLATSVGTRVTGHHYDLLILDDIVDFDNCSTPKGISKVFEWSQDMESVVDPPREVILGKAGAVTFTETVGDEVVVLGTRYDANDYYHYLLDNLEELEYRVFIRNIHRNGQNFVSKKKLTLDDRKHKVGDPSKGYIWAEKFTPEYVARLRTRTTAKRFASQYLNTILTTEEAILKPELLRYFKSGNVEKKENGSVEIRIAGEVAHRTIKLFLVVDTAISQKTTADNTVLTVGGCDEDRNVFVVDTRINKYTPSQTIDNIYQLCDKWNLYQVNVETNGVGASLPYGIRDKFKEYYPIVIREIHSSSNKKERLESRLQPLFENSKLFLADWMATHQTIQDEILFFPRETAKDDFLDTIEMLCQVAFPTPRTFGKPGSGDRWRGLVNTRYGGTR